MKHASDKEIGKVKMETWKKAKLGEITDSSLGKMLDKEKNKGQLQPYLANWNVRWGYFDLDNLSLMKFEDSEEEKYGLNYGDIIICEGGEPGRCAIWKNQIPKMKIQKALHRVRCHKNIDNFFLFYQLLILGKNKIFDQFTTGSTIKHIPAEQLKKVPIVYPPLPTQQKIASILSAYDKLIQNYKRQIEALKTAASELYKEWFVRFRFPGYQTIEFENGIPEGWKVVLASELGEFVRGKNITAEEMQEGMIPVISAGIEPSGFHNQSNVKGVSLTISNSGANAGYLQINYSDIWAADCSYCNSAKHIYFYYELLNNMRVVLFNLQKGAAQPHVYAKDINKMKILLPSTELIGTANKKIKLMHEKIYSLQQQITNLTQQRNLLLPRLMSGKIEIK